MTDEQKTRHTFHFHTQTLEKLRDAVRYIQKHPGEFDGPKELIDNLSRFAETAVIEKIIALEDERGKAFPRRRKNQSVHFGRPPLSKAEDAAA
jgi:hypothetical protein